MRSNFKRTMILAVAIICLVASAFAQTKQSPTKESDKPKVDPCVDPTTTQKTINTLPFNRKPDLAGLRAQEEALLKTVRSGEVVVVADVVEAQPPEVAIWSGILATVQHVRYRLVEVLKGQVKTNELDAGHYLVKTSLTADKDVPRLSPTLFAPHNRLMLILSRAEGRNCKLANPSSTVEAFCSPNENYGATLASPTLLEKIRSALSKT